MASEVEDRGVVWARGLTDQVIADREPDPTLGRGLPAQELDPLSHGRTERVLGEELVDGLGVVLGVAEVGDLGV